MRAAVLHGQESVRVESVPVPDLRPGDLLVRVRAALTCGTDVKTYRRGYHARMIQPPALFGHEVAGDVVASGEGVTGFKIGDRVVASNSAPCGECFYCRHDQANLCEDLLFNNGAYAEYLRLPARLVERNTYKIPDHLDYADAALMEPLACVVKGLRDVAPLPGDSVTIIGLGPIGMMFVKLAKQKGARVIAVGRRQEQVDNAVAMGADDGVSTDEMETAVTRVRKLTGGRGTDIAIEAVGKPELWQTAVHMLRRGGKVNFFGGCPAGTSVALDTELLHYSELTCLASFHHTPADNREALEAISQGHVRARDFVGGCEPLSAVPAVLARLMRQNSVLKTAILP